MLICQNIIIKTVLFMEKREKNMKTSARAWVIFVLLFIPLTIQSATIPLSGEREVVDTAGLYLRVDPQGRIYIPDRRDSSILVLGPDGKKLARFGRQGEGPGEFKRWFGSFGLCPDGRILQVDFWGGNRSISCFSQDGIFQWVRKIRMEGQFGPEAIYPMNDGRLILPIGHGTRQIPKGEILYQVTQTSFFLAEESGQLIKALTVVETYSDFSDLKGQGWPRLPFQVDLCTTFDPISGRLAYQKENENQVHIIDVLSGKKSSVANGFTIQKQTEQKIRNEAQLLMKRRGSEPFEPLYRKLISAGRTIEENLPIVNHLLYTDTGDLLIGARGPEHDSATTLYILDRSLRLRGPIKRPQFPAAVMKGLVYDLFFDDEEGYSLIITKWTENI